MLMKARDDNPQLHRIEVERNEAGEVESVRFVCDGGDDAPCHHYPDCGCETWGEAHYVEPYDRKNPGAQRTPRPGHEDVQQRECWIDPWFNATTDSWSDFTDLYDGPLAIDDPAVYGENADWLVSGPVSVTFEGDYMTWEYAAAVEETCRCGQDAVVVQGSDRWCLLCAPRDVADDLETERTADYERENR